MPADNHHHLVAVAARRSATTRQKATEALRQLDATGTPITFTTVADHANVSRSWLYRDPQIRAEIERLRTSAGNNTPIPVAQRASDASLRRRLDALLEDNQTLRQENRRLQAQVETLLGRQRADPIRARSTPPMGPCN